VENKMKISNIIKQLSTPYLEAIVEKHTVRNYQFHHSRKPATTSGRFNPFHNEHHTLVGTLYEGNYSRDVSIHIVYEGIQNQTNLFDFDTTKEAILACFPEIKVVKIPRLIPKNAFKIREEMRKSVRRGDFYGGGELPHKIAAVYGTSLRLVPRTKSGISATEVRDLMIADDDGWKEHIPDPAVPIYQKAMDTEEFKIAQITPGRAANYGGLVKA